MNKMTDKLKWFLKSYLYMLNTGQRPSKRHDLNTYHFPEESVEYSVEVSPHDESRKKKYIVPLALFFLTFITTTYVGILWSSADIQYASLTKIELFLKGLPYSVTVMIILFSHEMGHFLAAYRFGVRATLPFFIPFPSLLGTAGAVIKIKSPIPDRRALFYIGIMGPLAGFICSIIALWIGVYLSEVKPIFTLAGGTMMYMGEPLLLKAFIYAIHGSLPPGYDVFLSPYGVAGWFGCLITSLNLMPIGQLDGGHILYALIGKKQVYFGWAALIAVAVMSIFFPGWILWIILSLLVLMIAHPPIPAGQKLSVKEKIVGWSAVIILIICFIPVPVKFVG